MANNNYLWQEFNIKTFPSETIVFRNGIFMPDLSTLQSTVIDKKYDLPIHIIYVGEIGNECNLNIDIQIPDQDVYLTAKITNHFPAFLNIFVKNTGKNSVFHGRVLAQNYDRLEINNHGSHEQSDTTVIINTKIIAHSNSVSKLTGIAEIHPNRINCESDIRFMALAAPTARIEFTPKQLISAAPLSAEHSASLYRGSDAQIQYLRTAGLGTSEIKDVLEESFMNDNIHI
ncbi:SufD family Fe-S cluster assembly protein [Lachnospiraceae bacterium OttesenSCG-928-E19]|nr:SufD family Fe-S cluster assembly protein [Lachnospiraceae bacterium OttesenSCG-928-E19]